MLDRDVFNGHIVRGVQSAARRMHGRDAATALLISIARSGVRGGIVGVGAAQLGRPRACWQWATTRPARDRAATSGRPYDPASVTSDMWCAHPALSELVDVVAPAPGLGPSRAAAECNLTRLFQNHVREFDALVDRIDRPGWRGRAAIIEFRPPAAAVG